MTVEACSDDVNRRTTQPYLSIYCVSSRALSLKSSYLPQALEKRMSCEIQHPYAGAPSKQLLMKGKLTIENV